MINHIWSLICTHAVIDRDTNSVSIQNVLEQINIPDTPKPDGFISIRLEIVSLWTRSNPETPTRGQTKITLVSPSKKKVELGKVDINLSDHPRCRTRLVIGGFPAREPGRYTFRVDIKKESGEGWRRVAFIPLEIVFDSPNQLAQTVNPPEG